MRQQQRYHISVPRWNIHVLYSTYINKFGDNGNAYVPPNFPEEVNLHPIRTSTFLFDIFKRSHIFYHPSKFGEKDANVYFELLISNP
jgi:hypothetical protein